MIISGKAVAPRLESLRMRELYEFLMRESSLVIGFRRWWEDICEQITRLKEAIDLDETKEMEKLFEKVDAYA